MKYGFVVAALAAQGLMVTGQILLKRAMARRLAWRSAVLRMAPAIGCMTLYFFLWLAVARRTPLSQLAPFDALGPVLLVGVAHFVLRERLGWRGWAAVGVVVFGLGVIAFS